MMKIDQRFIWDYDLSKIDPQDEVFKRWYLSRVLSRGSLADIRALGIDAIRAALPSLFLPQRVRHFWDVYLSLPNAAA